MDFSGLGPRRPEAYTAISPARSAAKAKGRRLSVGGLPDDDPPGLSPEVSKPRRVRPLCLSDCRFFPNTAL